MPHFHARMMLWVAVAAAVTGAVSPNADAVAKQMDSTFAARKFGDDVEELDRSVNEAVKQAPEDYDVLWRAARAKFWEADSSDATGKRKYGKEGWDLAERAISANSKGAEGYYYAAINIGAYGEGVGIWKALTAGLEGKFLDRIGHAIELDAQTQRGGPLIAKARYFYTMPWPKRDLSEAQKLYKKALKDHPENLRAWYYLAQAQLKAGDAKAAKESIDQVYSRSTEYDPAEGAKMQKWAQHTRDAINEELQ